MTRQNSETASPGRVDVRPRRSHKKSRNGCKECKGRHTKCDERRPACANCSASGRQCSYLTFDSRSTSILSSARSPSSPSVQNSATPSSVSPQLKDLIIPRGEPEDFQAGDGQFFTIHHLALLHHAETQMGNLMMTDHVFTPAEITLECAFEAPYLMDELLALSALHLSTLHPARENYYRHQSTQLQTRALSLFTQAKEEVTDENCIPMLIFSSTLGLHILCDTLRNHRHDFSEFLDRFIAYLQVHRGVRAVTNSKWHIIRESIHLKTFLDFTYEAESIESPGKECKGLERMLDNSDLGPASTAACRSATKSLQWVFNLLHHLGGSEGIGDIRYHRRVHAAPAFPIVITEEFIDVLKQRRPEALIILAHYGVVLHWCRDFWIFGDAGQFLIKAITAHLGAYWKEWLEWPNAILEQQFPD